MEPWRISHRPGRSPGAKAGNLMSEKHLDQGMMRMKRLAAETGVPKGTIQYYVKEGLIPKPVKTHANMAYYTQEHVDAIRLVKELQSKRFLPLSVIRQMVRGERGGLSVDEVRTLVEIDGRLFQNMSQDLPERRLTGKQLAEKTGISLEDIRNMERLGILHPFRQGRRKYYDEDDIRFLECGLKLREVGFTEERGFDVHIMRIHLELMQRMVEEEAKVLTSRLSGQVGIDEIVRMVEEGTPLLNTMIGLIHKRLIVQTTRRYAEAFEGEEPGSG